MIITLRRGLRVLFLDDMEDRHEKFLRRLEGGGVEVDQAWSAEQAILKLSCWDYEAVFLDHDLKEDHYWSEDPDAVGTGLDVARWMADALYHQRLRSTVVIHSMNPVGSARMADVLDPTGALRMKASVVLLPFHRLLPSIRLA